MPPASPSERRAEAIAALTYTLFAATLMVGAWWFLQ